MYDEKCSQPQPAIPCQENAKVGLKVDTHAKPFWPLLLFYLCRGKGLGNRRKLTRLVVFLLLPNLFPLK